MGLIDNINNAMKAHSGHGAKRLSDLEINEISLVDSPANPGAKVMLVKRNDAVGASFEEAEKMKDLEPGLAELLEKGSDYLLEKESHGPLSDTVAWMARYTAAEAGDDKMSISRLEAQVPSVGDIDLAINALSEQIRQDGEEYHNAYRRALSSNMGRELYGLRDDLVRAGDAQASFSDLRQMSRDARARGY